MMFFALLLVLLSFKRTAFQSLLFISTVGRLPFYGFENGAVQIVYRRERSVGCFFGLFSLKYKTDKK